MKDIEVRVIDNDIEKAMRILKKKIQNDGLFKRLKLKKSYEKPSEHRRRKMREALRRDVITSYSIHYTKLYEISLSMTLTSISFKFLAPFFSVIVIY